MEDVLRLTLLFDFYANFLTEKQQTFFKLHYFNDLSLAEIAESYDITPQAVRDILKRTTAILERTEEKLTLISKFEKRKHVFTKASKYIYELDKITDDEKNKIIGYIESLIN